MDLFWMKSTEAFDDMDCPETQFTLFDPGKPNRDGDGPWETYVANVQQVPHGPEKGLWQWSVTVSLPGPRNPYTTNGREPTRKDAGERAKETYLKIKAFYAANPWPGRGHDDTGEDAQ